MLAGPHDHMRVALLLLLASTATALQSPSLYSFGCRLLRCLQRQRRAHNRGPLFGVGVNDVSAACVKACVGITANCARAAGADDCIGRCQVFVLIEPSCVVLCLSICLLALQCTPTEGCSHSAVSSKASSSSSLKPCPCLIHAPTR